MFHSILDVPLAIKWNNAPMTLRGYEKENDLTDSGNTVTDLKYTEFSAEFKAYFPMYGTRNRNDGDSNNLDINKPVFAYMIKATAWTDVATTGWTATSVTGNLLGPNVGAAEIFEKYLDPNQGPINLDNSNAYYVFRDGNFKLFKLFKG